MTRPGKVYLVGAGPGDPELLTLKGRRCLEEADVVLYDHLIDQSLLSHARPGTELILGGKRARDWVLDQEEINNLLVEKALEGKVVVRLKGGDPFVLGRGGEEAEALVREGVPYEVVPGITSAIAVPAYAGIPVTHRRLASSFAVVTGHEDPTREDSRIAWDRLATAVDTLIFLMGMENLAAIARKLIEHGRPAATPVALVHRGTGPRQETLTGTLQDIAGRAKNAGFGPPAVTIIGEVAGLREGLRWFDNRPLFGKRVLVTRSRTQASHLSRLLARAGAEPIELPTIEIEPASDPGALDRALGRLDGYDWLVFTSTNAVEAFFGRLRHMGRDARALGGAKICAIGLATAGELEGRGLVPDLVPPEFTSRGIIDSFKGEGLKGEEIKGQRFLLPRADIAGEELAQGLSGLGARVEEVVAYKTVPAPESRERAPECLKAAQAVTFTSSSTVRGLMDLLGKDGKALAGKMVACIGPVTAGTAREMGLRVDIVAREHTIPGLVAAMSEWYEKEGS
ncbi:MAG: uroporphyrinogen-III C-methyltransferase [Dehalococcoidia bacterium]